MVLGGSNVSGIVLVLIGCRVVYIWWCAPRVLCGAKPRSSLALALLPRWWHGGGGSLGGWVWVGSSWGCGCYVAECWVGPCPAGSRFGSVGLLLVPCVASVLARLGRLLMLCSLAILSHIVLLYLPSPYLLGRCTCSLVRRALPRLLYLLYFTSLVLSAGLNARSC